MNVFELVDEHFKMQQGGTWEKQQAKVKAEKDAKLKLLLQDKDFLNNLKEQSKSNKNKEVNLKSSDATKVVTKNRPELTSKVARNKTDQEIADERQYIREQSNKNPLNTFSGIVQPSNWTRENLASSAKGLESEYRVSDKPNFFDEWLNPANMIGNMASNLGQAPLQAQQSDSILPYVTSVGMPLAVGALAGLGTQNTGQFVNNLANPLAGTGDLVNNLGNKYLPNAHKLNPYAFRTSPENFYRQVDNVTYNEGLESGLIRGKQDIDRTNGEGIINLNKSFGDDAYYNKGSLYYKDNRDLPYLFEANLGEDKFIPKVNNRTRKYTTENTSVRVSKEPLPINDPNITTYKKDWLKGYKQIETPKTTQNFKSEIDWAKWNKEIPENKALMQEYNAIEQQAKAEGTWMKNPDGSIFQGTPEQFVQQSSKNFKNAYPNGFEQTYRGTQGESPMLKPNRAMFTGSEDLARGYTSFENPLEFLNSEEAVKRGGTHNLAYPKSENSLVHDTRNSDWQHVNLSSVEDTQKSIDRNIERISQDIERKKNMAKTAKQHTEGYWEFPNSDIKISDKVFKEGTSREEQELQKLIDIKNNGFISTNSKLLSDIKTKLGNQPITDDIAKYIEDYNIDNITLKNIEDGSFGDISMINHKPGNYLKSLWGNNGMFDMTNPNIYKSIAPIVGASYLATQGQEEPKKFQQGGEFTDNEKKFLEELDKMQQGGKAIYTNDKNDPRYRAYQDSLKAYNFSMNLKKRVEKTKQFPDVATNSKTTFPITGESKSMLPKTRLEKLMAHPDSDPRKDFSKYNEGTGKSMNPVDVLKYPSDKWYSLEAGILPIYKEPTQPVQVRLSDVPQVRQGKSKDDFNFTYKGQNLNIELPSTKQETTTLREKQRPLQQIQPQGIVNQTQNIEAPIPNITSQAQIPKSFDIEYSAQRMNGGTGYYDQNNVQNVDLETALRAQEQADRMNQYWQEKYGNSQNPKAQERLQQLNDNVKITPNYQMGGEYSENEKKFLEEVARLKLI